MASQLHPRPLIRYRKPIEDKPYREWIQKQRCLTCPMTYGIEAAHTRQPGQGGQSTKTDDATCVPLCSVCHRHGAQAYHQFGNEAKWAAHHGLDLPAIKANLRRRYMGDGFDEE